MLVDVQFVGRPSLRIPWVVAVSIWLVIVPLGLLAARAFLPSDGLPVLEASGSFTRQGLRVGPPNPVHQILDGDRVVSIDGLLVNDLLADPDARSVAVGEQHDLIVRRGSERFATTIEVGHRRQFGALLVALAPLLTSTTLV